MRLKNTYLIILILCMTLLQIGSFTKKVHAIEDAIIAIVNDEVITLRDLHDYIRTTYISLMAQGFPEEQIKQIMLNLEINGINKLIEDKLMLSAANELGLKINKNAINEKVDEIKNRYVSEEEFIQSLIAHGANITDLRNKIKEQLKIKYIIDYMVRSKIYINPKAVTDFYSANTEKFIKGEERILNSIFIPYKENLDLAKTRAQEALDAITNGTPFDEVARKYSIAPPIGRVKKGQLLPSIEKEIYSLKKGEISKSVELDNGIYILKVTDIIEEHTAELSEVKDNIKNILFKQKFNAKFQKWLGELKNDAYIEIKE